MTETKLKWLDRLRRRWGLAALALVAISGAALWLGPAEAPDRPSFRTAEVRRGDLTRSVSATGTLEATVTVEVGSQISGQISELSADYNSPVSAGQVIARIDPATFQARLIQATAELASAEANVAVQEAALEAARADLLVAEAAERDAARDLVRKRELAERGTISTRDLDAAILAGDQAKARVAAARARIAQSEASLTQARASVLQRQAARDSAQVDLDRTAIRSPIDGVVIGRSIDIGQTVAASLQAPVLFTIAETLTRMRVEVAVDEADIGAVVEGQSASFTVDAYPTRSFDGTVEQVRKAPNQDQNVVTYTVLVSADNAEGLLLPGMTANVEILVDSVRDALIVPAAALRLRLPPAMLERMSDGVDGARPPSGPRLFKLEGGRPRPVSVDIGINDGSNAVIVSPDLKAGDAVVVGFDMPGAGSASRRPRFPF